MKTRLSLFVKIAVGLAVLGAAGLAAVTVALKKYLPPEKIQELIVTQSRKTIGREVKLQGVELGALSGLVVKGIEVSEKPDFKAGTFVSIGSFQLKVKLAPLMYRSVVVDKLKADGVKAQVRRFADGTFNFSDLLATSTAAARPGAPGAAAPAPSAQAMPFALKVSKASLVDAEVSFNDAVTGAKGRVEKISGTIWGLSLSDPFEAEAALGVKAELKGKPYEAKLEWRGTMDYAGGSLPKMSVGMKKLAAEYSGVSVSASGKVSNFEAPTADLRADVGIKGVQVLEVVLAGAHLSSLSARPLPDVKGSVQVVTKGFSTEGLQFLGVPKIKVPESSLRVEGGFVGGDLRVSNMIANVPPWARVDGSVTMLKALSEKPEMDGSLLVDLDTPEFRLADLPSPAREKAVELLKQVPPGLPIPGIKLKGKVAFSGQQVAIAPTAIQTKFGRMTVSGKVAKPLSSKPEVDASVSLDLDLPAVKASDLPVALPASIPKDAVLPGVRIAGEVSLKGETLGLKKLKVDTKFGSLSVDGSVDKLLSKLPEPKVDVGLSVPAMKLSDLPIKPPAGLPAGFALPAITAGGSVAVSGDSARLQRFSVSSKLGKLTFSGNLTKLSSGRPGGEGDLDVELSKLTTSDIPVAVEGLPPDVPIPVSGLKGKVRLAGDDLSVEDATVATKGGSVKVRLSAKGLLAGKLAPEFEVKTDGLKVPAFKSADIPLPNVPKDLDVPETLWEVSLKGTQDAIKPSIVKVSIGKNEFRLSFMTDENVKLNLLDPAKLDWRQWIFYAKVKAQMSLKILAEVSPFTKSLNLSGKFYTEELKVKGTVADPMLSGNVLFQDLGIRAFGLDIAGFKGEMKCTETEIRIPKMEGRVQGGSFDMDFAVKDYLSKNPKIDVDGKFGFFDVDKILEAKKQFMESRASLRSPKAPPAAAGAPVPAAASDFALDTKRSLSIKQVMHANVEANDIDLKWDLRDITPDLKKIGGEAKVRIGQGKFIDVAKLIKREPSLKALGAPISAFQGLGKLVGFPDLNNTSFSYIDAQYKFRDGVLTIENALMCGTKVEASAEGTINLADETLNLRVIGQAGRIAPIAVDVTGTMSNPKTKKGFLLKKPCPGGAAP
ncbi:MAG: hypothetical protein HY927_11640 [Elusimicrobia bacterium]|nr:hypothetical protein [Elusimicrobiota bacterium]